VKQNGTFAYLDTTIATPAFNALLQG